MNYIHRTGILFLIILLITSLSAQATDSRITADTVATTAAVHRDYKFNYRQIIAPGILITAGITGVYALGGVKREIRKQMGNLRGDHYFHADDYIQYAPIVAYLPLGFTGIRHRSSFKERLMAGASAYICMGIIVNSAKHIFRERRPDTGRRNSFPSGHSATAFMGAELLRLEYGNWIGAAGYTVATGIGFLRMYNNRHWYNDVLAGAGVGILSARVGYWLLPWERKLFKMDRNDNMAVVPFYSPAGQMGLSFAMTF